MLCGRNIEKYFGSVRALHRIDLDVEPGTVTALIGPSGAGKSTLIRALSLVDPPSSGMVGIEGKQYKFPKHNRKPLPMPWPEVTVVFQQLFLWPHLSLRRNIFLPIEKLNLQNLHQNAAELVSFLDLEECLDRLPYEVSIGQRQRAAIVRALALRPKYLFMDEVTSALDVEQVRKLGKCIRKAKKDGCGLMVVTHLLGFAKDIADNVGFIDKGELLESGLVDLLDHPKHQRVREFVSLAR